MIPAVDAWGVLDVSPRLLEVARERVRGGVFVRGDAGEVPFADGEFDAAVSVFGVIFARPGERGGRAGAW